MPHGNLRSSLSAKPLDLGRPAAALIVVQPKALSAELLPEHPVFFREIIAGIPLRLAPPAGPANQPELERIEGPAPGRRIPAKPAVTGAASRAVGSGTRLRALWASPLRSTATPLNIRAFRLDAKAELFGPPCVLSTVGNPTSEPEAQFVVLRQAYDDAFRQFSLQVRLLQSLAGHPAPDGGAIEEASRRLARAHLAYRERGDSLAQVLLSRAAKGAAACLAHRAQVERLAYQLWEEAGRPSGRAEDHWYLAERLMRSAA